MTSHMKGARRMSNAEVAEYVQVIREHVQREVEMINLNPSGRRLIRNGGKP